MSFKYICLAILLAIVFGINSSMVKLGLGEVNPLIYTAWRYICIWPLLVFVPRPKTSWQKIFHAGVAIGSTVAMVSVILYMGVGAGISSIMLQTQVFFTTLAAIWLWKEWPTPKSWVGMIMAFAGMACVSLRVHTQVSFIGIFMTLIAAMLWAWNNIVFRTLQNVNTFQLVVWTSLVMPLPLMVLSYFIYGPESVILNPLRFCPSTRWSLVYSAFASGLCGSLISGLLFKKYPATTVTPFMLLIPISGLIFAYFILGETLTLLSGVGCMIVLTGLYINQQGQRRKEISL